MEPYIGQVEDTILGQDFLTWLWFKSETTNGQFVSRHGELFSMFMEHRVSVQGGEGDALETAVVSGAMSELKEARLGLSMGKKVVRAQVRIELNDEAETWMASIKADDLSISSLKTPKIEAGKDEGDDPDARFLEKFYLIERFTEFFDSVYQTFLELRLGPGWSREVEGLRNWLAQEHE